jgi:hypothetical protein
MNGYRTIFRSNMANCGEGDKSQPLEVPSEAIAA